MTHYNFRHRQVLVLRLRESVFICGSALLHIVFSNVYTLYITEPTGCTKLPVIREKQGNLNLRKRAKATIIPAAPTMLLTNSLLAAPVNWAGLYSVGVTVALQSLPKQTLTLGAVAISQA